MTRKSPRHKYETPLEWTVEVRTKGTGWLKVTASSEEEAEEKAWAAYHKGVEVNDHEWGAEEMLPGRPVEK